MITNEQLDTLIGRLKVYGSESGRGKDHPNAIACRTAASVLIEQQAEIERLREALHQMVSAVCAETGFANAVRLDSGSAYPWPALDIAEENASAALGATK